jgi:hypothetical protein
LHGNCTFARHSGRGKAAIPKPASLIVIPAKPETGIFSFGRHSRESGNPVSFSEIKVTGFRVPFAMSPRTAPE